MLDKMPPPKKDISMSEKPVDYSSIPPLPRIQSTGVPKRATLPPVVQYEIQNRGVFTEKDSSFHSHYMQNEQPSIFRENIFQPEIRVSNTSS